MDWTTITERDVLDENGTPVATVIVARRGEQIETFTYALFGDSVNVHGRPLGHWTDVPDGYSLTSSRKSATVKPAKEQ